jgi:hypothetical protein
MPRVFRTFELPSRPFATAIGRRDEVDVLQPRVVHRERLDLLGRETAVAGDELRERLALRVVAEAELLLRGDPGLDRVVLPFQPLMFALSDA